MDVNEHERLSTLGHKVKIRNSAFIAVLQFHSHSKVLFLFSASFSHICLFSFILMFELPSNGMNKALVVVCLF
jgi:hypothetical protein